MLILQHDFLFLRVTSFAKYFIFVYDIPRMYLGKKEG